ncbi:MAG: 30S ribosomal protein S3 [Candidatus Harrisonbacteria bacterium]|nr:30S ribosomal protein S3 [Candidatus Harrisonbacteria bacterium]
MGQKIKPFSYRLGIINTWNSRWLPKKLKFKNQLEEDVLVRKIINEKIGQAGIVKIEIERGSDNSFKINIKAARPGLVIGRGGQGITDLTKAIDAELRQLYRKRGVPATKFGLSLNVEELRRSELSAQYMAQSIAWDFERRLPFRRTIKKYIEQALQNREVQGVKIKVSGRLDGAEIARREWLGKGKLPLQTLRANIDYGETTAFNTYGTVGVKVWLYKGEVFNK